MLSTKDDTLTIGARVLYLKASLFSTTLSGAVSGSEMLYCGGPHSLSTVFTWQLLCTVPNMQSNPSAEQLDVHSSKGTEF